MVVLEGMTMGVKAGVDAETLLKAVGGGMYARSPVGGLEGDLLAGKFDPASFALKLSQKDTSLAIQLAREVRAPMPLSSIAEQIQLEAMDRGWGNRNFSATDLIIEERAGVQVRAQGTDSD